MSSSGVTVQGAFISAPSEKPYGSSGRRDSSGRSRRQLRRSSYSYEDLRVRMGLGTRGRLPESVEDQRRDLRRSSVSCSDLGSVLHRRTPSSGFSSPVPRQRFSDCCADNGSAHRPPSRKLRSESPGAIDDDDNKRPGLAEVARSRSKGLSSLGGAIQDKLKKAVGSLTEAVIMQQHCSAAGKKVRLETPGASDEVMG